MYPVYDTYIEHMLKPFDRPETGIVYGRQVGDDRTKYSELRIMLIDADRTFHALLQAKNAPGNLDGLRFARADSLLD